jgi:hypothetical protein
MRAPFAVAVTRMDVWVRSAQQHQEERSISFISGSGSAAFRALHNDLPLSCPNAPSPCTAALFQQYFKDRQLVRHAIFHLVSSNVSFDLLAGSEAYNRFASDEQWWDIASCSE